MRKYRAYYYKEINDECVDCEIELEASSFEDIYKTLRDRVRVFKRIYKVEEI